MNILVKNNKRRTMLRSTSNSQQIGYVGEVCQVNILIDENPEEHGMFRSKPTLGSVCGGMCRALPFARIRP